MIRHHVLMTFNSNADNSPAEIAASIVEALSKLPALIPEITRYEVGADLGLAPGSADLALIAEFASVDDYQVYATHPDHVAVVEHLVKPNVATLMRAQIEI
jgi:hypothetical protein